MEVTKMCSAKKLLEKDLVEAQVKGVKQGKTGTIDTVIAKVKPKLPKVKL